MDKPVSRGFVTDGLIELDDEEVGWVDVIAEYNRIAKAETTTDVDEQFYDEYEDAVLNRMDEQVDALEDAGLSTREAQVKTLSSMGFTHAAIALLLGIEKNTVDEYARRVKRKRESAEALLDALDKTEEHTSGLAERRVQGA